MSQKTYTIQESGSVTLPADFRKKYGLKAGDEITFIETDEGLLISPRDVLIRRLLNDVASELEASNISLEDLMEAGREKRTELLKKLYGIEE
jgi:AbrB family looped-hinge helix DNA binding protein